MAAFSSLKDTAGCRSRCFGCDNEACHALAPGHFRQERLCEFLVLGEMAVDEGQRFADALDRLDQGAR